MKADGITSISRTNKLLSKAEEAMKKKDFASAIDSYEKAIKEFPGIPAQANLNLGHAYFQKKDYRLAQKNYLAAAANLTSTTLVSQAYQQIGNIFSEQHDYKQAMEWYKKSLKTQPENNSARFNYELAYKLNQKKEEKENKENKQNPEKKTTPEKKDKQDSSQEKKQGQKEDSQQKGDKKDQKQENGKDKQDPKSGSSENKKKGQEADKGSRQQDQEQPGESKSEADKKQEGGQEEKPDPDGKDKSQKKNKESNMDDPEAVRMDKKKLQEAGLTEEQAKSLLQAMRQNEVKYLQQRRFKSSKGGSDKDKPKW